MFAPYSMQIIFSSLMAIQMDFIIFLLIEHPQFSKVECMQDPRIIWMNLTWFDLIPSKMYINFFLIFSFYQQAKLLVQLFFLYLLFYLNLLSLNFQNFDFNLEFLSFIFPYFYFPYRSQIFNYFKYQIQYSNFKVYSLSPPFYYNIIF